jgi:hypothetical protein
MQIKTGRFTVIYPKSYGDAGISFARSLDDAMSRLNSIYPEKKFRIPVIIHNYTTESNGYVAWAPSRMEIYPTPEQNSIPLDPNTQLTIHELTHVIQMESINKGFTKAMSYITGQQFPGLVSSLLPLWFLEGDAVFSESVLTESGRGRVPAFQKQLKALMIENGGIYNYDKMVNGSFRNYVPDHYQSGYQMMAWSYTKYDRNLWEKALRLTADAPFILNPVNLSLSKTSSLTKNKLFKETFDTLNTLWKSDDAKSGSERYETLNPPKERAYINYYSPVMAGNDSIVAIKTSLSDPPSFVLIRPTEISEERILIPGDCYPWFISYAKGKLVWVESHSDPRWENRGWSVIKIMDLRNRIVKQMSFKTRYMSASISPDGNLIAATENTIENKNNLVFVDAWNGNKLETVPAPGNIALQRPQWDKSGKLISVIFLTELGEGIMSYSVDGKAWQTLIEAGNNDIQSSFIRNDSLFFVSSSSGADNIYLRKPDKTVVPITRSRFGISDLNLNGNFLIFSDYTSSGNNVCFARLPINPFNVEITKSESSYLINRFNPAPVRTNVKGDQVYTPVPYRKWQHIFRFHSWMPFYADLDAIQNDPLSIRPGFTLMTQNNLSSLISSFGYEYSDKRHKLHASIKWLGWYLVFESRIDFGNSVKVEKLNESVADPVNITNGLTLTNTISLPLTFKGGRFTKYLYLSASSAFNNDHIYLKDKGKYDPGQNELTGRFYFSNSQRSALRDIHPKWAQVFDLSYSFYPYDKDIYGDILAARTAFYFPGFLKNSGFKIRLEAQKQNPEIYVLGNRTSFSRSYSNIQSDEIRFVSADYYMPLAYPDFNLSGILYITRIRTGLFYDFTRGKGNYVVSDGNAGGAVVYHDYSETFRSFGVQLLSDFYLLRIPFMVTSGVEAAWRNFGELPYFKMLFNINLYGMSIGRKHI